jgi:hypothetical protein
MRAIFVECIYRKPVALARERRARTNHWQPCDSTNKRASCGSTRFFLAYASGFLRRLFLQFLPNPQRRVRFAILTEEAPGLFDFEL